MALSSRKSKGLNIFLLIFSLLVLVFSAYYLSTGKLALFQSGAASRTSVVKPKAVSVPSKPVATPKSICGAGYRCRSSIAVSVPDHCAPGDNGYIKQRYTPMTRYCTGSSNCTTSYPQCVCKSIGKRNGSGYSETCKVVTISCCAKN